MLQFLQTTETFMLAVLEPRQPKALLGAKSDKKETQRELALQNQDNQRKLLIVTYVPKMLCQLLIHAQGSSPWMQADFQKDSEFFTVRDISK